jgi:hypothetical protein
VIGIPAGSIISGVYKSIFGASLVIKNAVAPEITGA